MRTIAGLNSGLPGDKDIVSQFRTAFSLAERAGMVGEHASSLVDEAVRLAEGVRRETSWGALDPGYCHAALSRVEDQLPAKLANFKHVVIGGSTTSRSVLHSLYEHFAVKENQVTFAYRNHQGGQMKLLRQAVRHGRRLRVGAYDENAVLAAIGDADVIYYGIDRDEPVLDAEKLRGLRDFRERPLYVVDFNTSGSTAGLNEMEGVRLWSAAELDIEVEAFAEAMCKADGFPDTVREAESWIEQRSPAPAPPSLEFPCRDRDGDGYPSCSRCGRTLASMAEGSRV